MEDYVNAALSRGLAKIIFLEHLEEGIDYFETTWLTEQDFSEYFEEGKRLQEKYRGRLEIGLGVEVGYNPACREAILDRLSLRQWDRIGVSYHFYKHNGHFLNLLSSKETNIKALQAAGPEEVFTGYLQTLHEAVQVLPGTVLCHFDAALRYVPGLCLTERHHRLINRLLDAVAAKKMAVEINASGYQLRGEPFPAITFIHQAAARGIPLVAGSDAHRPEDVAREFDRISALGRTLFAPENKTYPKK